jgi:hypothetical protein
MKAIKSTVFVALLFTSAAVIAQTDSTHSKKQVRYFRKFSVQFGPTTLRFVGKKDPEVGHSKEGYGGHLLPAWNITDNHSVGLKMVWSYHNEQSASENFSLLANYQFTYFGGANDLPASEEKLVCFYGGLGIGFSNATAPKDSIATIPSNTSFAMMPYIGIRYWHLYADGHFHLAAGNKDDTYFGCSIGLLFGGGLLKKFR